MNLHVNGARLFVATHGHGTPMLVLHGGLGYDHTYFRPWLDGLRDRVQLVYYDQRGNGRSERPASWEEVDHDTWVDDADALRRQLGHDRIFLFGHSYGGILAQLYALRYGDHLKGLILCATQPVLDYPEVILSGVETRATPETYQRFIEAVSGPATDDDALARTARSILPLYFHTPSVLNLYDPMGETIFSAAAFNRSMRELLPGTSTLDRLHHIDVPTLVLGGADDFYAPIEQGAARLHERLPRSELVVFERSGHFPFIEEPDAFIEAVSRWIESND